MTTLLPIHLFTKADCPYCARAKDILSNADLTYIQHDVEAQKKNADASIYCSGVAAVPQIFFGDRHVNGSEELAEIERANLIGKLAKAAAGSDIQLAQYSEDELARGAKDLPLRTIIPQSDGTQDKDPEQWPILQFYKEFFGFWPNCFYYMHHWPEAYKLFVYCHNASAINEAKEIIGVPMMFAASFTTSNAHGCNYCQIHAAAIGGEKSISIVKWIEEARRGINSPENPFGPLEVALAELAAHATSNSVNPKHLDDIYHRAEQAQLSATEAEAKIASIAMVAAAFGFLNVFNDLTGVEAEKEWAQQIESQTHIRTGRHGVDRNWQANNLERDWPETGPSMEDMVAKYKLIVAEAGGVEAYARKELGLMPAWIQAWPQQTRDCHIHLYSEIMQQRTHSPIPSELKHLMARVSAIAAHHDYLAAVEGYLAHKNASSERAVERVARCYEAAIAIHQPNPTIDQLFSKGEQAALTLAWLSAQRPLTTPQRFVQPAIETYSPTELVHLFTVCATASLVQRFSAIANPDLEPEVLGFLEANGLTSETLKLRYPSL